MNAFFRTCLCCCWATTSQAQEGPFLAAFAATDESDAVRIEWTMVAGSTCMGTEILRSRDSSDFVVVGRLEGLCGSIDAPVDYSFTDEGITGFGIWYYRLALGLNGFSPILPVDHQLSSAHALRVFPNPADVRVTVVLRADKGDDVTIEVADASGRPVLRKTAEGAMHRLDVTLLPAGVYLATARWENGSASTRLVVL